MAGLPAIGAALERAAAQALAIAGWGEAPPAHRLALTSFGALARVALLATGEDEARAVVAALERTPCRLLEPVQLGAAAEYLLSQIEAQAPHVVVIAAGPRANDRASAAAATEILAQAFGERLPVVVLSGDAGTVAACEPFLDGRRYVAAPGDGWPAADAVRRLAVERLGASALAAKGFPNGDWGASARDVGGGAGILPSSSLEGVCSATEVIAERYDVDVLTLDLGAGHALAAAALGTAGQRRLAVAARDDLGSRFGLQAVLREAGARAVQRWLPTDPGEAALRAAARRGRAVPAGLPETVEDLLVDHAFAREALRLVLADLAATIRTERTGRTDENGGPALPPVDLLIGSGGVLAGVPRPIQAALILLDAIQPEALTQLALDRTTALPLMGRLAEQGNGDEAGALGSALERDGLLNLGLCVAPAGAGKEGELAIKVEVVYANRSPVTVEVPFGAIEVVPLPVGERASLKLWPAKEFDIGLGRGNAATPRAEVEGGAVGIVIDARGRPLALPESDEKRQAKLLQWLQATRAYPPLSFIHAGAVPAAGAERTE
jgi:hypothetical protein